MIEILLFVKGYGMKIDLDGIFWILLEVFFGRKKDPEETGSLMEMFWIFPSGSLGFFQTDLEWIEKKFD